MAVSLSHNNFIFFLNGSLRQFGEWGVNLTWAVGTCVCVCTRVTVFLLTRPLKLVTQSPLFSVLPSRIQNRVLSLSFPLNNQTRRDSPHSPLLPRATCRVLLPDVSSRVYDRTIWDAERNGRARRVMSC